MRLIPYYEQLMHMVCGDEKRLRIVAEAAGVDRSTLWRARKDDTLTHRKASLIAKAIEEGAAP